MTTTSSRSPGCFRAYSNEQKTLRAKLDQLLKWTRDLKSNIMKLSCKALQANNNNMINRQTIDQIHDDLDEYKRKFDRELGRIHDICDALTNNPSINGDTENLRDEILEALRRSPTYSSLEQHIYDDKRPRIRVKPRERIHPGQRQAPRTPALSTDTIKRKATQPIALQVLDTSIIPGAKRRSQIDAFKRSRSFTNIEHTETQLGMDYVEEDGSDLSWKPFGPKRTISQVSLTSTNHEQSNDEQPSTNSTTTNQSVPATSTEKSKPSVYFDNNNNNNNNDSSDEEFDIAWERRAKQKARKEAATAPTTSVETPAKRTVRFSPSTYDEPIELIELDLDETTQDGLQQTKDQNNNNDKQQTEIVSLVDDDETTMPATDTQSQIAMTSTAPSSSQQANNQDDDSQIIDDSDDEIIALSDDEIPKKSNISSKKPLWTSSEIQITSGSSQSQSLHNPYRVGIADPSLRSIFLPPPSSQPMSASNSGNRRAQGSNRKTSPTKRSNNSK
ncbi:unnamed protein product [Rotaria sp. Silwood1]|nr:unnamed protein product [Rotaria sp. Silwood1]CAF3398009.1 unnamed protein product [Rotaria sp. Silwood1]CAF3424384.1 unnamed protein product [Rotaria sp. Silwood1]CAF4705172.1 unnamed protein product [Rotaria sp. Silwood1]CAF4833728.1 unnamed protein product [Rotaria sp. Silwood1]